MADDPAIGDGSSGGYESTNVSQDCQGGMTRRSFIASTAARAGLRWKDAPVLAAQAVTD